MCEFMHQVAALADNVVRVIMDDDPPTAVRDCYRRECLRFDVQKMVPRQAAIAILQIAETNHFDLEVFANSPRIQRVRRAAL
jgi:hypothetical protein